MSMSAQGLGRRQNSFGRDLCEPGVAAPAHPSNNPTPTFCTLPRDSKACEVILQSHLSEDEIPQATRVRGVRPRSNDIIVYKMS